MARNKYPEETVKRILDAAEELFWEKGYEHTTIQNIIHKLGNLSKGAIYHHFKSKEEIVYAVMDRFMGNIDNMVDDLIASKELSGLEKLRTLLQFTLSHPTQTQVIKVLPSLMDNPKFLAIHLDRTIHDFAHNCLEVLIRQGIADGSIQTEYPSEIAEIIALLGNVWINPLIFKIESSELGRKCEYLQYVLRSLGLDILDDEIIVMIKRLVTVVDLGEAKASPQ